VLGQPVIDCGLAAVNRLQPVLDGEHFRSGQHIKRQGGDLGLGGFEPVEVAVMASRSDPAPVPIYRTLVRATDKFRQSSTGETKVTEVNSASR
jgi:hypothetical protein